MSRKVPFFRIYYSISARIRQIGGGSAEDWFSLAPPPVSREMMVDGMNAGMFGYRWLHRLNFVYRQNKNPVKSIYLF